MHYWTEIGIPIKILDWDKGESKSGAEVLRNIHGKVDFALQKFSTEMEEDEMAACGIIPIYYDEDGDISSKDEGGVAYNPEAIYDYYSMGGRYIGKKAPPTFKDIIQRLTEEWFHPEAPRLKEINYRHPSHWDSLHTSLIGKDISMPAYVIWVNKDYEIFLIDTSMENEYKNFKDFVTHGGERWKDYVWTTCDLHG